MQRMNFLLTIFGCSILPFVGLKKKDKYKKDKFIFENWVLIKNDPDVVDVVDLLPIKSEHYAHAIKYVKSKITGKWHLSE